MTTASGSLYISDHYGAGRCVLPHQRQGLAVGRVDLVEEVEAMSYPFRQELSAERVGRDRVL
jgi:hypothetical protein